MEQVPNIAMFLHENRPNFPEAFSRYLVPIVVRYLTDPNNQVNDTVPRNLNLVTMYSPSFYFATYEYTIHKSFFCVTIPVFDQLLT